MSQHHVALAELHVLHLRLMTYSVSHALENALKIGKLFLEHCDQQLRC